jgi:Subtilase family
MRKGFSRSSVGLLSLVVLLSAPAWAEDRERVIIRGAKPYGALIAQVRGLGGEVTQQYENVDAIAALVPKDKLTELNALAAGKVSRETQFSVPRPVTTVGGSTQKGAGNQTVEAQSVLTLEGQALAETLASAPNDYDFNNSLIKATSLQAAGNLGQGIIVGNIDSGTANSPVVASLAGTVIGGETFVTGDPVPSATSRLNGPHGTWTGTVIAGHALFGFTTASTLIQSILQHAPSSILPCPASFPATVSCVAMIGVAPAAKIYALKVFPSTSDSTAESTIIAAMDRAITLRKNFNNGLPSTPVSGSGTEDDPFVYNSLKIDVVNMSLGGSTLFAGRDLEDQLTTKMLEVGITLAASAGNDGLPAMTVGSPGSGFGSLTLGAASTAAHERILRDVQFGLGFGALYRPFNGVQTAYFSSRGPNADGRIDPEITANGFATFAQAANGGIFFVSGTSFSSPTAAGAAVLLRKAAPWASAAQIRNALAQGANPFVLADGSGRIDQGRGFLDVSKAQTLLLSGRVSGRIDRSFAFPWVALNVALSGLDIVDFRNEKFKTRLKNLKPGQVAHFFVPSSDRTDQFTVKLENVTPELPPASQNQLFGDDLFVQATDAPTSFAETPLLIDAFTTGASFPINNPQTGLVRLAVQGDWTNAGRISADLTIERKKNPQGFPTALGKVEDGEFVEETFEVPAGTAQLVVELSWDTNWGHYPTDDVDLYLLDADPSKPINFSGATIDSPERAVINNPTAGEWAALVNGFEVHGNKAHYLLRATADGVRLH